MPEHGHAERAAELLDRVQRARRRADLVVVDAGQDDVEQRREHHAHPERRRAARAARGPRSSARRRAECTTPQHRERRPASISSDARVQRRAARSAAPAPPRRVPAPIAVPSDHGDQAQRRRGPRCSRSPSCRYSVSAKHHADHAREEHERRSPSPAVNARLRNRLGVTSGRDAASRSRRRCQRREGAEHDEARRPSRRTSTPASRARGPGSAGRSSSPAPRLDERGAERGRAWAAARRATRGAARAAPTSAATPSGRLIRKIERQPAPNRSASTSDAAEDRPEHRAAARSRGRTAPNALPISSGGKTCADDAEALRDHERGEQRPGSGARRSASPAVGASAAQDRRGHGEAGDADQEQAPAAVDVAEPAAGDEADRERQRVAADDPLQRRSSWRRGRALMAGAATLTIVPSSRSMHSAARTTARISQRMGWPAGLASATAGAGGAGEVRTSVMRGKRTAFVDYEQCSSNRITVRVKPAELPDPARAARAARKPRSASALSRDAIVETAFVVLDERRLRRASTCAAWPTRSAPVPRRCTRT